MKYLILAIICTIRVGYAQNVSFQLYAPTHEAITYQGRIDFTKPLQPRFCYPGVSIKTSFSGTDARVILNSNAEGDDAHTNFINVIIDDSLIQSVALMSGKHTYILASKLSNTKHTIEIVKRTECSVGAISFLGFEFIEGTLLNKPELYERSIEFIGNSLTCGYGNEESIEAPPKGNPNTGFHSENENNYMAYGSITARALKANYKCVAYSGRGLYRNNTGYEAGTLPKIYPYIFPDESNSPKFDFNTQRPDVIVINLGSNDFFPEAQGDYVNEKMFTKTYVEFLSTLRSIHPNASIVCLVGNAMSDYWPEGRMCWSRIQKLVSEVVKTKNEGGDKNIHYFKLDPQTAPYGEDWHPSIATHQKMSKALVPFIQQIKNWN